MESRHICPACNALYDSSVLVCTECGTGLLEIPDTDILTGQTLDGRYEMQGIVGSGGMGTVYRANQLGMEREVAIKVLHARFSHDARAVKRFFREAQAASRLIHPNIVTVYDFGRSEEGHLYMVMELLEGFTLGDMIHYQAPVSAGLTLQVAQQILEALEEAHGQRLVHRDLKPDNILVSVDGGALWTKVLDFGIARVVREPGGSLEEQLSTIEIAGTPAYMSPEQILGREPDPRSDLYSLGVILFEMLTRRRPFDGESAVELCMKQLNEAPPSLASQGLQVSEALEGLVAALLAKEPAGRPDDARAVLAWIELCPEHRLGVEVPEYLKGGELRDEALGSRATRIDLGFSLGDTTRFEPLALGSVLDRSQAKVPQANEAAPQGLSVLAQAARRMLGRDKDAAQKTPVAVAQVHAEHPGAFVTGPAAVWLETQEARGWGCASAGRWLSVKAYEGGGAAAKGGAGAYQALVEAVNALQAAALEGNVGLRVGVAKVRAGDELGALDLARRLAADAVHGEVRADQADLEGEEIPYQEGAGLFLPGGGALEVAILNRPTQEGALLWGRNLPLRRLAQIGDEAIRNGPTTALICGSLGMGKSAVLAAFLRGRNALYMRAVPVAAAWPGYGVIQALTGALRLPPQRGRSGDLDSLQQPLSDRDRELLALVLLDQAALQPPGARALGKLLYDAVSAYAEGGALVIAIDDLHHLDRVSVEVWGECLRLARRHQRRWCFVGTSPWVEPSMLFADGPRVDLRPLGLRAMNQLARQLELGPRHRHQAFALAQGNPLALKLLAKYIQSEAPTSSLSQHGARLLPWLLSQALRQATPEEAEQAWLGALLGESGPVEDVLVQAARLYLEHDLPPELARWLCQRLSYEGPLTAELSRAILPPSVLDANKRAERSERLGFYRLAALELESALVTPEMDHVAGPQIKVANYRAKAGDVRAAAEAFDSGVRAAGTRKPSALLRYARTLLELGETEKAAEALDLTQGVLTGKQGEEPESLGEWLALRAQVMLSRGDRNGAKEALREAQALASRLARTDARAARSLEALVQECRAEIAVWQGDTDAARTNYRQARDAFHELGDRGNALRCLMALGGVEMDAQAPARAGDIYRAAMHMAREVNREREELLASIGLGRALLAQGELEAGSQRLRAALRQASREEEDGMVLAEASLGMAEAMLLRGLWADVARYSTHVKAASRRPDLQARALWVEAQAAAAEGRNYMAKKLLAEALPFALAANATVFANQVREFQATLD